MNFGNTIAKIMRKSKREEREMMWRKWEREKRNFGNGIAEIWAQKKQVDLPEIGDWLDLKKKKKKTELWQLW